MELFKKIKRKDKDTVILKLKFRTQPSTEEFQKLNEKLHNEFNVRYMEWENVQYREITPEVIEMREQLKELESKINKLMKENK